MEVRRPREPATHLHAVSRPTLPPKRTGRLELAILCTLLPFLALGALGAEIHVPPPIVVELEIRDDRIAAFYSLEIDLYGHWLACDPWRLEGMPDTERATAIAGFATFLREVAPVAIDRTVVLPVVDSVFIVNDDDENDVRTYVTVNAHFPAKGPPSQVAFEWRRFDSYDGFPLAFVRFTLVEGGDFENLDLTPTERGYTWHAPAAKSSAPITPFVPEPPPRLQLPTVSLGILGLTALALLFSRRRLRGAKRWALAIVGAVAALGLSGMAQVDVRVPWLQARQPDEAESRYLFESLLRNIYRAFDYSSESEIYDALAQSVDLGLIDSVYQEVYQSLILREEGGAVSHVRSVKVTESIIEPTDTPERLGFRVDARWQVTGTVEHWGHSHWRTNRYRARFTVDALADDWRITHVEVVAQERLDEPEAAAATPRERRSD